VLVVHGLGEHGGRYAEVARTLTEAGWCVVAHDHRGHGESGGRRGVIDAPDDLLADLARVIDAVRTVRPGRLVLLGHSLGGLVAGRFVAEGAQPVAQRAAWYREVDALVVDCAKLIGCDDEVAGQLATLLTTARRRKLALTLVNVDAVLRRLSDRLQVGTAEHEPAWRLLLELLQRHASQEVFEERAVDYAVTFELSPPSWEALPQALAAAAELPLPDDAHYLSGELKNARFDDLADYLANSEAPVLDFGAVRRVDFFSAGQLVNRIAPLKAAGRDVVIRSPNHLVAELMAVVGLNKQARILVPKS